MLILKGYLVKVCSSWYDLIILGGIVDIIIYQLKEDGLLVEFVLVSGGSWGGMCIDKVFNEFFINFFGELVMNMFYIDFEYVEDCLDFWKDFEFKKRVFEVNIKNEIVIGLKFVIRILVVIKEIEEKQSNFKGKFIDFVINSVIVRLFYRNVLIFENGILFMEVFFFVQMFVLIIDLFVNYLKQFYKDIEWDLKVILMVGGFLESSVI